MRARDKSARQVVHMQDSSLLKAFSPPSSLAVRRSPEPLSLCLTLLTKIAGMSYLWDLKAIHNIITQYIYDVLGQCYVAAIFVLDNNSYCKLKKYILGFAMAVKRSLNLMLCFRRGVNLFVSSIYVTKKNGQFLKTVPIQC